MGRAQFDAGCAPEGHLLVGRPEQVAEKISPSTSCFTTTVSSATSASAYSHMRRRCAPLTVRYRGRAARTSALGGEDERALPFLPAMTDTGKIAKNLERFAQAVAAHDRENPTHTAYGIGLAHFDMERLGLEEGEEILPGITIHADGGQSANFRVLCDGQHDEGAVESEEEVVEAVSTQALPMVSPGPIVSPGPNGLAGASRCACCA